MLTEMERSLYPEWKVVITQHDHTTWTRSHNMITHHNTVIIQLLLTHAVFSLFPPITTSAINYPIYGVQWHPEKSIYEWTSAEGINHSEHTVIVAQTLANFFVQEARKSTHSFPSTEEENNMLIYNYSPTYTHNSFEQIYYFWNVPCYIFLPLNVPIIFFYCWNFNPPPHTHIQREWHSHILLTLWTQLCVLINNDMVYTL